MIKAQSLASFVFGYQFLKLIIVSTNHRINLLTVLVELECWEAFQLDGLASRLVFVSVNLVDFIFARSCSGFRKFADEG